MDSDADLASACKAAMALETTDPSRARRQIKALAERGHAEALFCYAGFVEKGVGGRPSSTKAVKWFVRAAEAGVIDAHFWVGHWHARNGRLAQAKDWLRGPGLKPGQHWVLYSYLRAWLTSAELHSASRSVRATVAAKGRIRSARDRADRLDAHDLARLEALEVEYANRNPDPIWSPQNRQNRLWQHERGLLPEKRLRGRAEAPPVEEKPPSFLDRVRKLF